MPWPYFVLTLVIGLINQLYVDRKARPEEGIMDRMRVALDILTGKYDDERWPWFVRRFVFVSLVAFPLFAAVWWMLVQWTFPVCR